MDFEKAYPVDIGSDEAISIDVPVTISDHTIQFYSMIKPNKIIAFDTEKKVFHYYPFLEDDLSDEENDEKGHVVRVIENTLYAAEIDYDKNSFSISTIDGTGEKETLIKGKLPASSIRSDHWISDFYVIDK